MEFVKEVLAMAGKTSQSPDGDSLFSDTDAVRFLTSIIDKSQSPDGDSLFSDANCQLRTIARQSQSPDGDSLFSDILVIDK